MKAVRYIRDRRLAALLLAAALLLTSCGGGAKAASMRLKRTEGTVDVSDDGGRDIEPRENLGLYSGYGVDTRRESYAWIDLDDAKLTKLDQDSEIEIQKDGKALEIIVSEGSLFFNVTEPLEDDETMTIRASSMLVGIRGTCGWVEVPARDTMRVFLLEGKVRCEADGKRKTVRAGEMAVMTDDGEITVEEFAAADIPEFVVEEIEDDDDLMDQLEDLLPQGPSPEALASLGTIAYYGDPAACAMTPEQAAAFAQVIREETARLEQMYQERTQQMPNLSASPFSCYASLFDTGSGLPALFFGGGAIYRINGDEYLWSDAGGSSLWTYTREGGAAAASEYTGHTVALYDGYLFCGGIQGGSSPGLPVEYRVYPLTGSGIAVQPSSTARYEGETLGTYTVDGRPADRTQFEGWQAGWTDGRDSLTGHRAGGGVEGYFWGMSPVEDVLAVLDNW